MELFGYSFSALEMLLEFPQIFFQASLQAFFTVFLKNYSMHFLHICIISPENAPMLSRLISPEITPGLLGITQL